MSDSEKLEQQLIEDIAGFYDDPLGFVMYSFPWGEPGMLKDEDGPDVWQRDILEVIGQSVRDGSSLGEAIRIAVASGHGIGKTALIAWIIIWFISTREFPQIPVTANTRDQLLHKTWRELSKWHGISINKHWFQWTATKFYNVHYPETWFASAIPWSEGNSEAFAGTHEKHVLVIYDEASAIADGIWEVTEGAMTTVGAMWIAFGNPTRTNGRFKECFARFKHRWITRQVDSRTAKKASQTQIEAWIRDYGEDSDFVRVRVRGVFPRAGTTQFIEHELYDDARHYVATGFEFQPKVLILDVARFGDDQSVSSLRQGRKFRVKKRWRGLDTVTLANNFIEHIEDEEPDAIVIDGDGIGAGVIDIIRARNFDRKAGKDILTEFHGGGVPQDPAKYFNRRAEVWGLTRDALKAGFDLPDDPELEADLTGPQYSYVTRNGCDVIQLESKKDMKARGLASPDVGDTLCMSFAVRVRERVERRAERQVITVGSSSSEASHNWMAS